MVFVWVARIVVVGSCACLRSSSWRRRSSPHSLQGNHCSPHPKEEEADCERLCCLSLQLQLQLHGHHCHEDEDEEEEGGGD
jgi:hypothetical protein